jgi:hydroxymethylbilane synthase
VNLDGHGGIRAAGGEPSRFDAIGQVPIGAVGIVDGARLTLQGLVASLDGKQVVRSSIAGGVSEAEKLGQRLAERLLKMGAGDILQEMRQEKRVYE